MIEVLTKQGTALCYSDTEPDDDAIEEGHSTYNEVLSYTKKIIVLPCKSYLPLIGEGTYVGTCNNISFDGCSYCTNDSMLRPSGSDHCRSIAFDNDGNINIILQQIIDEKLHINIIEIDGALEVGEIVAFETDELSFGIVTRSVYNTNSTGVTVAELICNFDKEINTNDMTMVILPDEFLVSANPPDSTARYTHLASEIGWCHGELEDGRAIVRVTERVDAKYRTKQLYVPAKFLKMIMSWTMLPDGKTVSDYEPCNMVYLYTPNQEPTGLFSNSLRIYYSMTNGAKLSILQAMCSNLYDANSEISTYGDRLHTFAKQLAVYVPKYSDEDTLGALSNRDMQIVQSSTVDYSIRIETIRNIFAGVGYRKPIRVKHLKMEFNDLLTYIKQELIDDEANRKAMSARIMSELDMNKIFIGSSQASVDGIMNSISSSERAIREYEENINTYLSRARDSRKSLARYTEQLLIAKGILESRQKVNARTHIPTLFDQLEFISTNNTGILYFLTEPINLERDGQVANCGRLLLGINFYSTTVQNLIKVYRGVDCKDPNVSQYYHPHVNSGGSICFGNVLPRVTDLFSEGNVSAIVTYVRSLLYTFNAESPYINWASFMAVPNKIGQADELINITKEMR